MEIKASGGIKVHPKTYGNRSCRPAKTGPVIFRKHINHALAPDDPKRVTFRALPGRWTPRFGKSGHDARALAVEIQNCKKCDFGMGHFYQPDAKKYPDVWLYKEGKVCDMHKEQSEV